VLGQVKAVEDDAAAGGGGEGGEDLPLSPAGGQGVVAGGKEFEHGRLSFHVTADAPAH
jgi:hypothetical protein